MDSSKTLCFMFIISTLVLSWTDASLVTNVLQMMQRRYDANAKPGTYWRNPRSPVRIKKRRNLYEDNKYKERPEYKKKKSPAPPRQKRIDLDDFLEE